MILMSSQITTRIAIYYLVLILLVPYLIAWSLGLMDFVGVDQAFIFLDRGVWDQFAPHFMQKLVGLIPDSTWESLPNTLVGLALFYLVIPVCWDKIDTLTRDEATKVHVVEDDTVDKKKDE